MNQHLLNKLIDFVEKVANSLRPIPGGLQTEAIQIIRDIRGANNAVIADVGTRETNSGTEDRVLQAESE